VLQRRRNHNTFVVQRVDVSQRADIGERFRITETPSIMVIADGKVRARLTRPSSSAAIREQLKPWLR
jgi:thioredoxin-like negative regulator of GroEL